MKVFVTGWLLSILAGIAVAGCFYPPTTEPPPDDQQRTVIPLPYDLAWDAVNNVIRQNQMRVQAQDGNHGIIEAVGPRFTLHDADCGKIKSIVGTYVAEPEPTASSVYNFMVRPRGKEASLVEVRATFASPVKVPLHPESDVDCVSRGIQESNLLRQVLAEAKQTHRPTFAKPAEPTVVDATGDSAASRAAPSTVAAPARSSTIEKPSAPLFPSVPGFGGATAPSLLHKDLRDLPAPPGD